MIQKFLLSNRTGEPIITLSLIIRMDLMRNIGCVIFDLFVFADNDSQMVFENY